MPRKGQDLFSRYGRFEWRPNDANADEADATDTAGLAWRGRRDPCAAVKKVLWGRGWRGMFAPAFVIPSERSESRKPHRAEVPIPRLRAARSARDDRGGSAARAARDDNGARSRSGRFR